MYDPCSEWPAIADHRLLSDGTSAALVTSRGEIDWWCAPRFDSTPVLWSLLDRRGAAARFVGAEAGRRAPGAAGPVLETELVVAGRTVVVRDGLVDGALFRLVTADGPIDLHHEVGGTCHHLAGDGGGGVALRITVDGAEVVDAGAVDQLLRGAERSHARGSITHGGLHHERVLQAFDVLRACTYAPTGAIVASPTTSLPEAVGAGRQFDYRYTWLRDGSLVASVAALAGRLDIARRHLDFLCGLGDRILDAPLFALDGTPAPAEREVPALAGHRGSRPVRVGNAAVRQVQFDALGFVVESVSTYTREGGAMPRPLWHLVTRLADRCCDAEPAATGGIWELREPQELLSADIGRWIALDRALRIARRRRPWAWARRRRWRAAADAARRRVLDALEDDGRLPQRHGGDPDHLDASALLAVMFGLVDADDRRRERIVDAHLEALGCGPFLRRYRPDLDDGFGGVEGCFVPCSWWAVTALVAIGRTAEAEARADALCAALPVLLPEEVDAGTGEALGNVPLVWAHAELVRAMQVLEVAFVRDRWGRAGVVARSVVRRIRRRLAPLARVARVARVARR